MNLFENSAQSWYDAGYVNVRRRYSRGLSFLGNYTFAKALDKDPDFRSPMFEAATPQNNYNLKAEKGPACDVRHRFALSAVGSFSPVGSKAFTRAITRNWLGSLEYQVQSGFPPTISVFGDTANAGVVVGENPIRANATGQPVFVSGTRNSTTWFDPKAFATPPAYTFGNVSRNSVDGPGMQSWTSASFAISPSPRKFASKDALNSSMRSTTPTSERRTTFVNTANFGSITEVTNPGREIQLSARLSFYPSPRRTSRARSASPSFRKSL